MLLSFFIILNAISSFEVTKSRPVMNSLMLTFSNRTTQDVLAPGEMELVTAGNQEASALDKIEALFRSQISAVELKQNRLGTKMFVRMPFKDFQDAISSSLMVTPEIEAFPGAQNLDLLPMLVSLMETQRDETYKMDMILNIEQEPSQLFSESSVRFTNVNRSITTIAAKLEKAGLPRKQMSAGLKKGDPEMVELLFRRYQPFNPLGTDTALGEGEPEAAEDTEENTNEGETANAEEQESP